MRTLCNRWLFAVPLLIGAVRAAEPEKPSEIVSTARAFVELITKGDFEGAAKHYDEAMTKALPPDKLATAWKKVVGAAGPFQKQLGTRTEKKNKLDIVYVTCQFEKTKLDVRVVFDDKQRVTGLFFRPAEEAHEFKPPPYANRDAFTEKAVIVGAGGDWPLPGTLTLPKGDGPFPAVVLVHGSGPQDRDETIGPNKPFRDLAWGLASQGVAVLRYEKRTKHYPEKLTAIKDKVTIQEEVIDDALAAVALLRRQKEIDSGRIFVAGHSLGAIVAPRIGSLDTKLAGIMLLAGSPRPLEDIIVEQVTYLLSLKSDATDEDKAEVEKIKKQAAKLKDPKLTAETPAAELPLGAPATYWLALRSYDVAATAAKLDRPMLILQGERDYQVTMTDFAAWKKVLADRPKVRFKSYPQLNHLFMEGKGKSTPGEYDKAGHVARGVIDDLAAWVKKPR